MKLGIKQKANSFKGIYSENKKFRIGFHRESLCIQMNPICDMP